MEITPTRYNITVKMENDTKCTFIYEINFFATNVTLTFNQNTRLSEIAKCVEECFLSDELKAEIIEFYFLGNKVQVCKCNFEKINENAILEKIAYQLKQVVQ